MKFLHTFLIVLMMFNGLIMPLKADEDLFVIRDNESDLWILQ